MSRRESLRLHSLRKYSSFVIVREQEIQQQQPVRVMSCNPPP